jgi:cytochrome c2
MTKESLVVFVRFGSAFASVIFLLIVVNTLARTDGLTSEGSGATGSTADAHEGRVIMERNGCFSCHRVDGFGGSTGPELNGVGNRKNPEELFKWIKSPWTVKPGTRMPQFNLSDEAVQNIVGYLETKDSTKVMQ